MTPPHIPPDMAAPDFDEDEVNTWLVALAITGLAAAALLIGATIMLAWRGLQCGGL